MATTKKKAVKQMSSKQMKKTKGGMAVVKSAELGAARRRVMEV
jgi:hypothetical protein